MPPIGCKFETKIGNKTLSEPVEAKVAASYDGCPDHPPKYTKDWVILKLKNPIEGVTPYRVGTNQVSENQTVISVKNNAPDFAEKKYDINGNPIPLKSIGRCTIIDVYQSSWGSDCDVSQGNSGGAIVLDDKQHVPTLVGITFGSYETYAQLLRAVARHKPYHCDYEENKCASMHAPITGKFLDALNRAAKSD